MENSRIVMIKIGDFKQINQISSRVHRQLISLCSNSNFMQSRLWKKCTCSLLLACWIRNLNLSKETKELISPNQMFDPGVVK